MEFGFCILNRIKLCFYCCCCDFFFLRWGCSVWVCVYVWFFGFLGGRAEKCWYFCRCDGRTKTSESNNELTTIWCVDLVVLISLAMDCLWFSTIEAKKQQQHEGVGLQCGDLLSSDVDVWLLFIFFFCNTCCVQFDILARWAVAREKHVCF